MNAIASPAIAAAAHALAQILVPPIGTEWQGQGGIYAGLVRGQNGAPDYHLIVGPESDKPLQWKPAQKWANGLQLHGLGDFDLPARHEQAVLFGNVPELFEKDWYWSNAPRAESSGSAWCQLFGIGTQGWDYQTNKLRARAVRRLPIQ